MKKLVTIVLLGMLFIPGVLAQKTVVGIVEYKYSAKGEGSEQMAGMLPDKMISKYGNNGVSVEMIGGMMGGMMGKVVVDGKSGEMFMVKDLEQTVYVVDKDELEEMTGEVDEPVITKLDDTKEILGYKCKKYIQKSTTQGIEVTQIIWATSKLKYPDYDEEVFSNMMGQDILNFNVDGFPLLMVTEIPGTSMTMELVVSDIKFKKIKDSEFKKPAGYEEKPFTQMGMGM